MLTEEKAINISVNPAETGASEVVVRQGEAPILLEDKAPLHETILGTIGTPSEYLSKRLDTGQFCEEESLIIVNREKISIRLSINEFDAYNVRHISGILEYHPKFLSFKINSSYVWSPVELGTFIKMNTFFFLDNEERMKLVTTLMNFTARVNHSLEKVVRENGDRTDNFSQVVESNLPKSFFLKIPIFKGQEPETIEVETFAQINGREVGFLLLSPGANQIEESIRDSVIDAELEKIRALAPYIAIIEV